MNKKWDPKKMASDNKTFIDFLKIKEPPCKFCANFMPSANFSGLNEKGFILEKVKLCQAEKQKSDFTCFEFKESLK